MADYSNGAGNALAKANSRSSGETDVDHPIDPNPASDESGREDTFFLPSDFPQADTLKPGDQLTLRVVGRDSEGNIEVETVSTGGTGEPEWKTDLKKSVQTTPGPEMMGAGQEGMM